MRLKNEAEILDIKVRQQIIEEIKAPENQKRKDDAYKRYMVYKDQTKRYVVDQLKKQFDESTIREMEYSIANVSLVRKCVDKLAKVYSNGVQRTVGKKSAQNEIISELTEALEVNTQLKSVNRILKLQRNAVLYVKPCPIYKNGIERWSIKLEPLHPHLYDAIEHYYDRTKPMAYILSDYESEQVLYTTQDAATAGRSSQEPISPIKQGNGKDEIIADQPDDAKKKGYIWWTDNYHFTTNGIGEIISGQDIQNKIKQLPFVNYAIDQDGQFWAIGGDDLIDGGILINAVLTHNQHVAVTQGYGQFWMRGQNLPRHIAVGANKAILMEYKPEEPTPEIGFASANPPLDQMRALVEQYIALLLTTNNLSTSSVSSSLNGAMSAPSGIAMIIDKSESMEDINEQREQFAKKEKDVWTIIAKWLDSMNEAMSDELVSMRLSPQSVKDLQVKFLDQPVIQSEQEKLQNMKLRKELGLDSQIDLIMRDNPGMSKEEAEEKLLEIMREQIMARMSANPEQPEEDSEVEYESDESNGNGQRDISDSGPEQGAEGAE